MIEDRMPTSRQKRRVIYAPDSLWDSLEERACREKKSVSGVLREVLEGEEDES